MIKNPVFLGIASALILILAVMAVFATQYDFTTIVNLTVSNTTFRFQSEDSQIRTYALGSSLKDVVPIRIHRNLSCNSSALTQGYLSSVVNQSVRNQVLLNNCTLQKDYLKATCINSSLYKECSDKLMTQISSVTCPTCPICPTQTKSNQSEVIIGGICLVIGYLFGKKGFAKDSMESLPQNR